jgi:hypothetical protein
LGRDPGRRASACYTPLALTAGSDGRTVRIDERLMDMAAEIGLTHEVL